ncbi:MAG TPA: hypothetical protein VNT92_05705 [Acidimicrobiia bacterium]|nr:hypothetical protein [Acidimicrobiia bacterium]
MMKRNLRAFGRVLLAASAMSIAVVSAAQAEPAEFTGAWYPTAITGAQEGITNYFEITGGTKVECNPATYEATLGGGSGSLTVTPHYTGCTSSGINATVNLNGCHYILEAGTYVSWSDSAQGSLIVACPKGAAIQLTTGGICRVDIGPQTLNGVTYTNIAAGATTPHDYVTVHVDATNEVKYTETDLSFFCPGTDNHTTENGAFVARVRLKGYEDESTLENLNTPGTNHYFHSITEMDIGVRGT